jgi:ABC-type Fe3+-hydroxamate transport system substrate-binding protein
MRSPRPPFASGGAHAAARFAFGGAHAAARFAFGGAHAAGRAARTAAVLVVLALVLAGCSGGSAGDQADGGSSGGDAGSTDGSTPSEDGEIVLHPENGEVVLEQPATRIVALSWDFAEDAIALGVMPVGVADVANYDIFVGPVTGELPDSVADVGLRDQPSVEAIRALEPDLILGNPDSASPILDDLEAIAPTAMYDPYATDVPQLEQMRTIFTEIGQAVGEEEAAAEVLDEMDAAIEDAATQLGDLSEEDRQVAVVQGYLVGGVPVIRMFTDDSMTMQLYAEAGLENTWTEPGDEFGFTTTDIEGMTTVTEGSVLITADPADIEEAGLDQNPLYDTWPPLVDGRAFSIGTDAWTFGGPLSAEKLVDLAVAALVDGEGQLSPQ